MNSTLEYKGYWTTVRYSAEDHVLHGKIEGIRDLVDFESDSAADVERAFHEAVDDYLAFCRDTGSSPEKPFSGTFNVRISQKLHRAAAMQADIQGISLNQWTSNAMEKALQDAHV